jgi:hypothetical protein
MKLRWRRQGETVWESRGGRYRIVLQTLDVFEFGFNKAFPSTTAAKRFAQQIEDGKVGRCKTCKRNILNYGSGEMKECANCWEVERRLGDYLQNAAGRNFVTKALKKAKKR